MEKMDRNAAAQAYVDDMIWNYARYVAVSARGFHLYDDKVVPELTVYLRTAKPARTFYVNRKPTCRSIDGIRDLTGSRECASCRSRSHCTPQIYLEFMYERVPLRMLLAYTSARNFIKFSSDIEERYRKAITAVHIRMSLLDRGRWTEIRFWLAA